MSRPFLFDADDPRPMFRHLDGWARRSLRSPEAWGSTLELCSQWADYSARNQVLLASYGVSGPVAGAATWERMPSSERGRGCAVRVGEHGLPVRVPVVEAAEVASDRSRAGGLSRSVVASHRWETVFAVEQLARRPSPEVMVAPSVPRLTEGEWIEVVRVASGRLLGSTPRKVSDPMEQLAVLASRVPAPAGRVRLSGVLASQAGWVVANRVGMATGPGPVFDPQDLSARQRWQTLVDVRHASGRVLDAVSFGVGVELCRSAVARHDLVDDRLVPAGRRNYLAPADVRSLPLGVWVEAGPYTRAEWLARGVAGAVGVAAFLRVNDRSYLAAYETRTGALWRLETTGQGAHRGLVGDGTADNLAEAKESVRAALLDRFPHLAAAVEASPTARVLSPAFGWVGLPGGRDDRTEQRVFDERVAAMVSPGPGGRWQTWVSVDGQPSQGPLTADASTARVVAEDLAHGALLRLAEVSPDRANAIVAELAVTDAWRREALVAVVGHRLTDADCHELTVTQDPARLVELMVDVGVLSPATMLRVLHAEHVDAGDVVEHAARIGMPIPAMIRDVHDLWGVSRVEIGMELGATPEEFRDAGCGPAEMLAVAPRETLRRLDTREHTWTVVAPTLLEAGYSVAQTVAHLAAHAPTAETFAAGVTAIIDQPVEAFALAGGRAQPEDLAALSERYGLSPGEAATTLVAAGVALAQLVAVVDLRCDGNVDSASELLATHVGGDRSLIERSRQAAVESNVAVLPGVDCAPGSLGALRDAIGQPDLDGVFGTDLASLRAAINVPADDAATVELEVQR